MTMTLRARQNDHVARDIVFTYDHFVQRVRRYKRSDVISAVAGASIALSESQFRAKLPSTQSPVQQFTLAAVAKAAISNGNDFRSERLTSAALETLCATLIAVEEPILATSGRAIDLDSFMVRTAYEQFPFAMSPFEELSRTIALMDWAARDTAQSTLTPEFWARVLGCSLIEFVGLALLMNIGALTNRGVFDPSWVQQQNFEPILKHLDRAVIEGIAPRHFIADIDGYRAEADRHRLADRYLRRFEFNPLHVSPFVALPGALPTAPIPALILSKATPNGLYYIGTADSGNAFTTALGKVFETYVGAQLKLTGPRLMLIDHEYESGKRAADFILVFDSTVIIVEAKATPLTAESRLGGSRLFADLKRALGKGKNQILHTAEMIRQRHPAFAEVPPNLPQIGLVVTMEPYFQANSSSLLSDARDDIPVLFGSARELEYVVSLEVEPMPEALLRVARDPERRRWNLANALGRGQLGRNSILDAAWATLPFKEVSTA